MSQIQFVTRFAPSPTGVLHIGGARTALFNYLFTRQNKGKFILRIEDTDTERSKPEYEEDIKNGLKWLGLEWDEFFKQSERKEIYKKYLKKIIEENKAYISKETNGQRKSVIRFRNPNKKISFDDAIRGRVEFNTTELGDFVIAKDEETPLFHFAGVVDDFEMGVTHIIRGEDHISNTPRQILIQEALGFSRPVYSHLPLILGPDRTKLSKRHGAVSLNEYRKDGYLPQAIINFLTFLGWNPGDEREIFSKEELIKEFSLKRIQKSGAIFNIEKLNWINSQYIKKMDIDELTKLCTPYLNLKSQISNLKSQKLKIKKIVEIQQERINNLSEAGESIDFFFKEPEYPESILVWKPARAGGGSDKNKIATYLEQLVKILCDIEDNGFTKDNIKKTVWDYTEKEGRGNVLWPFRVALTGLEKSPDPFTVAEILGKSETIKRLQNAIKKI